MNDEVNDEIEGKKKSNFWSYVILLFITGVFGSVICMGVGYIVSELYKMPHTTLNAYGWRGVSACVILYGILFLIMGIMFVIEEGLSELFASLLMVCLFTVIPSWFSVKYLKSEKVGA